ncbi:MAG TPA: hypothetical protein VHG30_15065 [Microvirga sp.]|nr:hypothetical protein [Microvirga sp.]
MSDRLKIGQAVVPAFSADRSRIYDIVRLRPAPPRGEPAYEIRCRLTGSLRLVGELEIKPAFADESRAASPGIR